MSMKRQDNRHSAAFDSSEKRFRLWQILSLLALVLTLQGTNANAENPLKSDEFLKAQLQELGFFRQRYYKIRKSDSLISFPTMKDVPFDVEEGLLAHWNIIRYEPHLTDKVEDGYTLSYRINDYSDWALNDTKLKQVILPQRDGSYALLLGSRKLDKNTYQFSEWKEQNSEFAMVEGKYNYKNRFSGYDVQNELRVIVERHPTSSGWYLSQYRGVKSGFNKNDESVLARDLTRTFDYSNANAAAKRSARKAAVNLLLETNYPRYRRNGDVLQIDFEDYQQMIYLRPVLWSSREQADAHCENLNVQGFNDWYLPNQYSLARVFHGSEFSDWDDIRRLKEAPNNYFWGPLISRLNGRINYFYTASTEENDLGRDRHRRFLVRLDNLRYGERSVSGAHEAEGKLKYIAVRNELFVMCLNGNFFENSFFSTGSNR